MKHILLAGVSGAIGGALLPWFRHRDLKRIVGPE